MTVSKRFWYHSVLLKLLELGMVIPKRICKYLTVLGIPFSVSYETIAVCFNRCLAVAITALGPQKSLSL